MRDVIFIQSVILSFLWSFMILFSIYAGINIWKEDKNKDAWTGFTMISLIAMIGISLLGLHKMYSFFINS